MKYGKIKLTLLIATGNIHLIKCMKHWPKHLEVLFPNKLENQVYIKQLKRLIQSSRLNMKFL